LTTIQGKLPVQLLNICQPGFDFGRQALFQAFDLG
jgi:hypothetical protein